MIKKAFQCDPLPWTLLYVLIVLMLCAKSLVYPLVCEVPNGIGGTLISKNWILSSLRIIGISAIPFWFRSVIRQSGVLDFKERVSLYPIALFLVTSVLSCNSLLWIILTALLLGIFAIIVKLREDESLTSAAFKTGILISLCSFSSPYFLLLILFVLPSFSILRALDWRSTLWHVLGVLAPWYLGYSIHYILSGRMDFHRLTDSILIASEAQSTGATGFAFIFYLVVIISVTILMLRFSLVSASTGIVRRRKFLRIGALFFFVTLIISAVILQFESVSPFLSLISIPLAIIYLELLKEKQLRLHSLIFILWLSATFMFVWN